MRMIYILSLAGSIIGAVTAFDTMVSSEISAIQEAAGFAMAAAWAVIPYCFCRSIEKMVGGRG